MASITDIYVFGDSLADDGNAYLRTGGLFPPPPYAQRASNGPVAVERLAANLGVPLAPSLRGGTNYAIFGAATGQVPIPATPSTTDSSVTVGYPPLAPLFANTGIEVQVSTFVAPPSFKPATSLFLLWGGANDFFINPSATTAAAAVSNLADEALQLYGMGARNFLVPNIVDLSLTPDGLGLSPADHVGLHNLSVGFDAGLASALNALALLPGMNLIQFDTLSLFTAMIANPAAYGFTNVTEACYSGSVCSDPSSYLFWDTVHPTTAGASVLGDQFTNAVFAAPVPEPAPLLLLASGLAGLAGLGWGRNRG